jgi:hypothetical protein
MGWPDIACYKPINLMSLLSVAHVLVVLPKSASPRNRFWSESPLPAITLKCPDKLTYVTTLPVTPI